MIKEQIEKFLEEKEKEGKVIDTIPVGKAYNFLIDPLHWGKFTGKCLIDFTDEDNQKIDELKIAFINELKSF